MTDRVRVGSIQVDLGAGQAVEVFDAVVVLFASAKIVLARNARRAWEFPGGRREDGESYQETAVRDECCISDVGLFDKLPVALSFGDGRERLLFEQARERALRKSAI